MTNGALKSALVYVTFAKLLTEVQCQITNWLIQCLSNSPLYCLSQTVGVIPWMSYNNEKQCEPQLSPLMGKNRKRHIL